MPFVLILNPNRLLWIEKTMLFMQNDTESSITNVKR